MGFPVAEDTGGRRSPGGGGIGRPEGETGEVPPVAASADAAAGALGAEGSTAGRLGAVGGRAPGEPWPGRAAMSGVLAGGRGAVAGAGAAGAGGLAGAGAGVVVTSGEAGTDGASLRPEPGSAWRDAGAPSAT